MTGEELREALRSEMAATTPPPPMSTASALGAARKARVRRRIWACAGTAVAVMAIAGLASFLSGPGIGGLDAAGFGPDGVSQPSPEDTTEWFPTGPNGEPQPNRTAKAGPRYEKGVQLLNAIVSVVPAGYTAPENPPDLSPDRMPLRDHQAQFEDWVNGAQWWSYLASASFAQGERMGRLLVEVHTVGTRFPTEPCALAEYFWVKAGECRVVTVTGTQVGIVLKPNGDKRFDQWAAYRYPDGVVVFVAQALKIFGDDDRPPLSVLPFTVDQLATLAVDARFHLP